MKVINPLGDKVMKVFKVKQKKVYMSTADLYLKNAPIVEAVLDIDCDMSPKFDLVALEGAASACYLEKYPKLQKQFIQELQIETKVNMPPQLTNRHGVQAFQFRQDDEKQLVQVRAQGFSFNRLAPYDRLDDYLPEIERTWRQFMALTAPVQIRFIRLRYINRILLPMVGQRIDLGKYLKIGPRLPDENKLTFVGFLNQHNMMEVATGNHATIVLSTQVIENGMLPLIFDNSVMSLGPESPDNWPWILAKIQSLRNLKNLIFECTLTPECLKLFQQ